MLFWIDIEFTKIWGQFKQKKICKFFDGMKFRII